jgi:hypothetical protein
MMNMAEHDDSAVVEQPNPGTEDDQTVGSGEHSGEMLEAGQQANEQGSGGQDEDGEDEVVITIDGVSPAPNEEETDEQRNAPQWVKDMRKEHRELKRQKRELEQKLAEKAAAAAPAAVQVGEKPSLESCDFDAERFESELTAWHERKRKADEQADATRKEQEAAQQAWQKKLTAYGTAKTTLKVPDFEDAEEVVKGTLSPTQQAIIVSGAENPATLVYALGKNPAEAKKLASITDPVQFAFATARLETKLTVTPRKKAPAPERQVRGSAAGVTGVDSQLERLEAEADRTGDRSKVIAYRREQRRAQAKS